MTKNRASQLFLLSLTAVVLCFGFMIMKPFLKPIVIAAAIAIVFYPLHNQVRRLVHNPNAAALLSTLIIILTTIVPAVILGSAVSNELTGVYQTLSEQGADGKGIASRLLRQGEQWTNHFVQEMGLPSFDVRATFRGHLKEATSFLMQQAGGLVSNLVSILFGAVIAVVTLFFLFREGSTLRERAGSMVPLAADQVERLCNGVHNVIVGSVYGMLAIGALQGLLTGVAFYVLGLPSPVLWGLTVVFLSPIPVVGTGGVWITGAIFLLAAGHG
jgi:predicted PurR-regulated permease PerM